MKTVRVPAAVDAHDDRLAAKNLRALRDQIRSFHRRAVERDFVRAAADPLTHVGDAADAPAPRQRHEACPTHRIEYGQWIVQPAYLVVVAAQIAGVVLTDIDVDEFIHAPLVEPLDLMDRVAEHLMDGKGLAAHEQSVLQEQERDEPLFQHDFGSAFAQLRSTARPALWLFSG